MRVRRRDEGEGGEAVEEDGDRGRREEGGGRKRKRTGDTGGPMWKEEKVRAAGIARASRAHREARDHGAVPTLPVALYLDPLSWMSRPGQAAVSVRSAEYRAPSTSYLLGPPPTS